MEAIAERIGIRKASLYYYFRSKDEILVELHEAMIATVTNRQAERIQAGGMSARHQILAMMGDIIGLMETHPGYLRVFFEHSRELPEASRRDIAAKRNRYRQMMVDVLRDGMANGEFGDLDPDLTSFAILSMCNWVYQWFRPGTPLTAAELAEHYWRMLITGIGQPQTRADTTLTTPVP